MEDAVPVCGLCADVTRCSKCVKALDLGDKVFCGGCQPDELEVAGQFVKRMEHVSALRSDWDWRRVAEQVVYDMCREERD